MTNSPGVICFCSVSSGVWGAERSMMTLAGELRSTGVEVHLLCVSDDVARAWEQEVGAAATVIPLDKRWADHRAYANFKIWSAVARRDDWAAIVVFSYVLAAGATYYRARRGLTKRDLLVLDLHDNLEGPRGRFILRLAARAFDVAISVSRHTDTQLEGLAIRRSVIYRPVVTPPPLAPRGAGEPYCVGIIGRIDPQKKIDLAVDAMRGLDEGYRLILRGEAADGGDANFSSDLIARAAYSLGSRLQYEGPVEWSRVLHGLDLLVVCNEDEPMGRTVAEAQLAGLLVLVPSAGGSSELVEHGVTGLVYAAADAKALADGIVQAAENSSHRDGMIRNAKAVATGRHETSSYALRYLEAMGQASSRAAG